VLVRKEHVISGKLEKTRHPLAQIDPMIG